MPTIYSNAVRTIAWLGGSDDNSDHAIDLLGRRSNVSLDSWDELRKEREKLLLHLYERPYWKRACIVQELLKAKDVTFLCGKRWLSWESINRVLSAHRGWRTGEGLFSLLFWKQRWNHARTFSFEHRANRTPLVSEPAYDLLELIEDFHSQQCEDPRDRIFAYHGLARDEPFLPLPDYSKDREALFVDFVVYLQHSPKSCLTAGRPSSLSRLF
jgi:hypothetical protein